MDNYLGAGSLPMERSVAPGADLSAPKELYSVLVVVLVGCVLQHYNCRGVSSHTRKGRCAE